MFVAMSDHSPQRPECSDEFEVHAGAVELTSNICGVHRSWFLSAGQVKVVGGRVFVNLVTGKSNIRLMFTSMCADIARDALYTIMAKTDITAHLKLARGLHVRDLIKRGTSSAAKRFDARSKMYTKNILQLPEVIEVIVPSVHGVDGITVGMLSQHANTIWLELTPASLKFIAATTAAKLTMDGVAAPCGDTASDPITDDGTDAGEHDRVEGSGVDVVAPSSGSSSSSTPTRGAARSVMSLLMRK